MECAGRGDWKETEAGGAKVADINSLTAHSLHKQAVKGIGGAVN